MMVHRALWGSVERFFGVLIEHYAGAFPLWLAPVQVKALPITDAQNDYARGVVERLEAAGVRAELDARSEKIGFKIREAQLAKVPYMLVVGPREAESGQVAVRHRSAGDLGAESVDDFLARNPAADRRPRTPRLILPACSAVLLSAGKHVRNRFLHGQGRGARVGERRGSAAPRRYGRRRSRTLGARRRSVSGRPPDGSRPAGCPA